jgi:ribonuclease VapC
MMAVDSSALVAILFEEPEGSDCVQALEAASSRSISAVNRVETGTVLVRRLNKN